MVKKEFIMEDINNELKNHEEISVYKLHKILNKKFSYSYGSIIRVVDILDMTGVIKTKKEKTHDNRIVRLIYGGN